MVRIKSGDLLEATEKVIGHQVNCYGAVGGLAASVFSRWPYAKNDYLNLVDRYEQVAFHRIQLLGLCQLTGQQKDGHIIANLYGQLRPGKDYRPESVERALRTLGSLARQNGWSVALPYKLSCGLCGGDWNEVYQIIERTMHGVDCTIYKRECDE